MTIAYVYKWTHIPTLKWYVGSRTATNCHPDDGYICHSKDIKPLIVENSIEWSREIIATGTQQEMYELETTILSTLDAKNDPRSFNKHNNDGIFVSWGDKHPNKNSINAKKISDSLTGIPKSKESILKMSQSLKALGDNHPSRKQAVKDSKRQKMLSKGQSHHQKTPEARLIAKQRISGDKNPMFGKIPHHKILNVHTPYGVFNTVKDASLACGVSQRTILRWLNDPREKYKEYFK
jgi:hypothetical protein